MFAHRLLPSTNIVLTGSHRCGIMKVDKGENSRLMIEGVALN